MPSKVQISSQKVISEGMWPSKAVIFALVAKIDFATMLSQIDNLQGQFTMVLKTDSVKEPKKRLIIGFLVQPMVQPVTS